MRMESGVRADSAQVTNSWNAALFDSREPTLPEIASIRKSSFVQALRVVTRQSPSVKCRVPTLPDLGQSFDASVLGHRGSLGKSSNVCGTNGCWKHDQAALFRHLASCAASKASIPTVPFHVDLWTNARAKSSIAYTRDTLVNASTRLPPRDHDCPDLP